MSKNQPPRPNRCRSETTEARRQRCERQRAAHRADGYARITHGTLHGANMGCPCEPCRTARNQYKRRWRHEPLG